MTTQARPVVVTGASRGLGAALARHFAQLGHDVAVCARTPTDLQQLAAELHDAHSVAVVAEPVDVIDEAGIRTFAARVADELGPCCAVVNNAGILGPVGPLDQLDLKAWRHALEVNVIGAVTVTAAFLPQMVAAGGGAIVNLGGAGIGGTGTHGNISAYTTSKGALVTLTEALSKELHGRGVRVNAIAPGGLATGFMDPVLQAAPGTVEDSLRAVASALLPATNATPIQLDASFAELLTFLVSSESEWLTGKLLSVRWDNVASLRESRELLARTSLLNLRRIDDALFTEVQDK
ncbi:MAG: SDR family NAD(P)-dependent oxidoreductase [Acidimicrobiia bacterium]